jgi:RNA-directed DNA polymerase
LAETVLSALERRVLRKGLSLTRYNDDFRINCGTWSEVVRALEILSEEARNMGFFLNDSKVLTYRRSTYESRLERAENLRAEIAEEAELDLTHYLATYDGDVEVIEPVAADVDHLTAVRVLERWQRVAGRGQVRDSARPEHAALLQLVPLALRELSKTSADAPKALDIAMDLLRYEQPMTPMVCDFLTTRQDDAALLRAFDRLLRKNVYLTGWQAWWLQQPLARMVLTSGPGSRRRKTWLEDLSVDAQRSPVLRANAARTLARHGLVDVPDLLTVYDRASPVERPVVVEAMALLKPSTAIRSAVTGDSKLHEWIYDWAASLA